MIQRRQIRWYKGTREGGESNRVKGKKSHQKRSKVGIVGKIDTWSIRIRSSTEAGLNEKLRGNAQVVDTDSSEAKEQSRYQQHFGKKKENRDIQSTRGVTKEKERKQQGKNVDDLYEP